MEYEKVIHALIDNIVSDPSSILIRVEEGATPKDVVIIIASEKHDTAHLIGKKGVAANALREMINVAGKSENKRIHLKFESFEDKEEEVK